MPLDIFHDRPSTILRKCQVFCDRIVLFLPSIKCTLAEKASCIIRVCLVGFIVETRMRQLLKNNRQSLRLKRKGKYNTHLSWRRTAMWPANWFRGFCTRISSSPGQYRLEAGKAGVKRLHFLAHCCEKGLSGSNSSRAQKEGAISVRVFLFSWPQKGSGVVVIGVALCLLRCFDLSADTRPKSGVTCIVA